MHTGISLRDYQEKSLDGLREAYRSGHHRPLLVCPTGGGKTVIFCYVSARSSAMGNRVLILVHRAELLRQTSRALERMAVPHGMIAPGYTPSSDLVQVASVQALVRRLSKMAWRPDLIVVDEAHHAVAGTWAAVLACFPEARVLGVTATPCRLDGRGLSDVFDHLVVGPSTAELTERGFLTRAKIYAPPVLADLSHIKIKYGDFAIGQVSDTMDKPAITGDAVSHYKRLCAGQPAIAFCASVNHAHHVAAGFKAAGFNAACLDGSMGDQERAGLIEGLGNGRVHVLTSCEIVSEGTDIPVVTAAILLRPTQSEGLFLQQVGRVLRPVYAQGADISTDAGRLRAIAAGPKPSAIILDHVGNIARHGFPDDVREWTLDGRQRRRGGDDDPPPAVRQCPQCFMAHKPAPVCPGCGFLYQPKERQLEQRDGELEEVKADEVRQKRAQVGKAKTLEELQAIEKARGYKPGWALHVWRARSARRSA